jgi:Right handed beta helix region
MNSTKIAIIGLAASLAAVLPAIPAQATSLTRTFVSSAGSDSNPCTITQPCATFARAYSLTTASGIIAALDPGKYGPLTITGPLTINGNGWAAITGPASGNAITINANSNDKVSLIGLEIDGANAANSIGIELNSGASLTVRDCAIQNFTRYGILYQPTASSKISVMNTQVSDNNYGIYIGPNGPGTFGGILDHVHTDNNTNDGITITGSQQINVTVTDSVIANNGGDGVVATTTGGNGIGTFVRNSTIVNNAHAGLDSNGAPGAIFFSRNTIVGNGAGYETQNSGAFGSYHDNNIELNFSGDDYFQVTIPYH